MKRLIALTVLVACSLSACSTARSTPAASSGPAHGASFPATVTPSNGPVTVAARPTRIMSLSASATQMIYAMGAGHQVVAVDKYSTYPPNAPRTNLTGFETSPESYVRFHPDLVVLAQNGNGNLAQQLATLGIPALVLPPANTVEGTYNQITLLGKATGHEAAAEAEVASIRQKLAAIVRSVGSRERGVTYYIEVGTGLYTATSDTFIGALYSSLGMVNIADAAGAGGNDYPQLSTEYLLKANPDYVFLADGDCCGQTAAVFAERPGFSVLRAVRLRHVFDIPDAIASEWGPRIVDFLQMAVNDLLERAH